MQDFRKQLVIGNEKYLITNTFYAYLLSGTNRISDYNAAKSFVKLAVSKALKGEAERVNTLVRNKIDIEL